MIIHAVLGSPNHPEYGVATIPFPIPHDQYAHCMELLEALEIGDAVNCSLEIRSVNTSGRETVRKKAGLTVSTLPNRKSCSAKWRPSVSSRPA